jgi:hypothetical protein
MKKPDQYFQSYRTHLTEEIIKLTSFISLYQNIDSKMKSHLRELNVAPAFFGLVQESLYSSIIIWIYKLFDPGGERGFVNFLRWVQSNIGLFSKDSFCKRKNYKDDHWIFTRLDWKPITKDDVTEDLQRIERIPVLGSVKKQRDQFYAHFDKKFFFNQPQLHTESPIKMNDLNEIVSLMDELLNKYSTAYDGRGYSTIPVNISDMDHLLSLLRQHKILLDKLGPNRLDELLGPENRL